MEWQEEIFKIKATIVFGVWECGRERKGIKYFCIILLPMQIKEIVTHAEMLSVCIV